MLQSTRKQTPNYLTGASLKNFGNVQDFTLQVTVMPLVTHQSLINKDLSDEPYSHFGTSTTRSKLLASKSPKRPNGSKPIGLSPSASKNMDDSRNLEASPFPLGSVL